MEYMALTHLYNFTTKINSYSCRLGKTIGPWSPTVANISRNASVISLFIIIIIYMYVIARNTASENRASGPRLHGALVGLPARVVPAIIV